jgi:Mn-dependent DtxR family transcriptional regulator
MATVFPAIKADLSLAQLIVKTLKEYGGTLPQEYLARVLNQRPPIVEEYVRDLEQKGVVTRQQPDVVTLIQG